MTSEYNINAPYYFLKVSTEFINSELLDDIKKEFGYPINEVFILKNVLVCYKELLNENWGISIQIAPYKNYIQGSTAADKRLTKDYFELAKQYYKVSEFLTLNEYQELPIKENILT